MSVLTIQIIMILTFLALILLICYIKKQKNKTRLHKLFIIISVMLEVYLLSMFSQLSFAKYLDIPPIYFEYITGCVAEYIPVIIFIISLVFYKNDINLKNWRLLYVIPTLSLISLWTNDFHHLFYRHYSIEFMETTYGPMFYIHCVYSYALIFISVAVLIWTSMKKSGFFSKQTLLIISGCIIPIFVNVLATFKIVALSVYITPVLFGATAICFAIAIIKYKALNITPVAFRTVMDTMSDSYIVISDDGTIVSTNKTFDDSFSSIMDFDKNKNFFEILKDTKLVDLKELKKDISLSRRNGKIIKKEYHLCFKDFDKYFEVDIHPIAAKSDSKEYVGTLLLFKDITQHMLDMEALKEKQEIIVKQGQLVSIGELAGGVAHDINTPISAIKTGIVMLRDMKKDVPEAEKEILNRMDSCATKIINIVNSMRNQIRNLGSDVNIKFKVSEVINDIKIITYHEFAKNKTTLNINIKKDVSVIGDPTKLGQVFTNLTVNAVQAYKEKKNNVVEVTVDEENKETVLITVKDYAGGIDEKIVPFVFKNILTTKGTNGTGLGLYLVYSIVKGEFNGDITFDTKVGEGTTFYIRLPKA